jgi:hypothetical protein
VLVISKFGAYGEGVYFQSIYERICLKKQRVFLEETYMQEYQSYILCPEET